MWQSSTPFLVPLIAVLGLTVPPLFVLLRTSAQREMAAAPAPVDGLTTDGLTPTGQTLVREANVVHGDTGHWSATERVSLDQALRRTAVTGIPRLSRVASREVGPKHRPQDEAAPAAVVAAGDPGIDMVEEGEFDFGFRYQFVEELWPADGSGGFGSNSDSGDGGRW